MIERVTCNLAKARESAVKSGFKIINYLKHISRLNHYLTSCYDTRCHLTFFLPFDERAS
jgi:hypothetical protein